MADLEKFRAMIGMLEGQFETCKLVIKGDGPQALLSAERNHDIAPRIRSVSRRASVSIRCSNFLSFL